MDTSAVIRDLGYVIDTHLSMASQVKNICNVSTPIMKRLDFLSYENTRLSKSVIHGLVTSRLECGNAMLFGMSDQFLHRLEMVLWSAARMVMQILIQRDSKVLSQVYSKQPIVGLTKDC